MRVRVFVVDDHELIREGIRSAVEREPDLDVVGEASTAREAQDQILRDRPDIVVLDLRLPDGSGIEVCREIRSRHPEVRFLVLTSYQDDHVLFEALMAGAAGFILKGTSVVQIIDAIRRVAAGQSLLDVSVTDRVLDMVRAPTQRGRS